MHLFKISKIVLLQLLMVLRILLRCFTQSVLSLLRITHSISQYEAAPMMLSGHLWLMATESSIVS